MFSIVFVTLFVSVWLTTAAASPLPNGTRLNANDSENQGEVIITVVATEILSDVDRQRRADHFNHSCINVAPISAHNHAVKRAVSENRTTVVESSHVNITATPTVTASRNVTVTTTSTVTVNSTVTPTPSFAIANETSTSATTPKNETKIKLEYVDEDEEESFLEALKETVRKVVTYSVGLLLTPFVIGAQHISTSSEPIESNQIDTIHF